MSAEEKIIYLRRRIDSTNARETERMVMDAIEAEPDALPVFDASELIYISSAGLRVLVKYRAMAGTKMEIRNVSPEVYEIMEMTGFTELFRVKKRFREVSVEGCEIIGRGCYGTVYRLDDDTIVKVYASPESIPLIENERRMARMAFIKGIPTAISYDIVKVGDSYASMFELLKAQTMNDLLISEPGKADDLIRVFVDVMKSVHAAEMDPGVLPSARDTWLAYLENIRQKEFITQQQYLRLKELLNAIPERNRAVHGDYHMKNVMMTESEPMLIDMDTLSCGDPVFDLQAVYVAYREFNEDEPDNSENFLGIDDRMCERIWQRTLALYFDTTDPDILGRMSDRIRLVAAIRFLCILESTDREGDSLGAIRIRHTQAVIEELLDRVPSLSVIEEAH